MGEYRVKTCDMKGKYSDHVKIVELNYTPERGDYVFLKNPDGNKICCIVECFYFDEEAQNSGICLKPLYPVKVEK